MPEAALAPPGTTRTRGPFMRRLIACAMVAVLPLEATGEAQVLPHARAARHPGQAVPPSAMHPIRPSAVGLGPVPPPVPLGAQPVDVYIRRALVENRTVQAAYYNVLALKHRIPQVSALDDPVVSNTILPSSTNGLQTAAGYLPWNLLIAQQFPWFGTLRLRAAAASDDVRVAIAELAAAQLDVVEAVKRAYYDLYFNERAEQILLQNRDLLNDFLELARVRYETGQTSQQDVLRAEVMLADIERELITTRQALAEARAALAQQLHISPESDLRALPSVSVGDVPAQVDRLYQLAVASRPELSGRLAAVARDEKAVDLARKRYYPNITLGVNYGMVSRNGALSMNATGNDNVGLFVGFNVPIYRGKIAAGVCEARARAMADAKLYEAEKDGAFRQIKDLLSQARSQSQIIALFRDTILPRAHEALKVASIDYQTAEVDYLTLITAWREVLQIELQAAQLEASLGQSLASLERAVGVQLSEHPIGPSSPNPPPAPPASNGQAPFELPALPEPADGPAQSLPHQKNIRRPRRP